MTSAATDARADLRADCSACDALCCVVLPFTRSADFPESKPAGVPCRNLRDDDRCSIHGRLRPQGWVGCTVYDCFGAGQQISAHSSHWRDDERAAVVAREALPVLHQLHEMLWYLRDPAIAASRHREQAAALVEEVTALARQDPDALAGLAVQQVRTRVAMLLRAVSDDRRGEAAITGRAAPRLPRTARPGADLSGARLRRADLRAAPLRGALLLGADLRAADLRGADLLGADLRGADLRGADLRGALFLTEPQLAAAHGDGGTRTDSTLARPGHWA